VDWLNYHHLLYFWVVAHEGSVSRAGEVLHVTPATVSIQIRELERSLGVQLFRKSGRGLALTDMGEEVYRYANDIFALGRELVDMVKGRPIGRPLLFRVGVKDALSKLVVFKLLEPHFKMTEKARLVVVESDISRLVASLSVHKLDVVLSDTQLDPSFKVRAWSHLLGESPIIVMGAKKLVEKYREGFPGSLNRAPFLFPTEQSVLRRSLDVWFEDNDLAPDIRGEFDDSAMLKIAARAGAGLFAAPAVIRNEIQAMYGVEPLGILPGVQERYYALSVERKLKHPAVVAISESARKLKES
jgi:LysR family transcriptional activator of nhaA